MPRIPINQFNEQWDDDDLEHDHLGRPMETRKPRRPRDDDQSKSSKRKTEPVQKNND
jgi:hypothetical protein